MEALLAKIDTEVKAETVKEQEEEARLKAAEDEKRAEESDSDDSEKETEEQLFRRRLVEQGMNVINIEELVKQINGNDSLLLVVNLNGHITVDGMQKKAADPKNARRILHALTNNTIVKELEMASCNLESDVADSVSQLIILNKSLEKINLDTNSFSSEAIAKMVESLKHNKTLKELKVANQKSMLTQDFEQSVAKLLEPNETLIKLSVNVKDQTCRNALEKVMSRNREIARKKRLEQRKSQGVASNASPALKRGDACSVCEERVYVAERLVIDQPDGKKLILHKRCFKCKQCRKQLTVGNHSAFEGKFFCMPHYKQRVHKAGGSLDKTFGASVRTPSDKAAETPEHIAQKFASHAREKCNLCKKTVYLTERLKVELSKGEHVVVHRACLKCMNCKCRLDEKTYVAVDGWFFCKKHGKEAAEAALKEAKKAGSQVNPLRLSKSARKKSEPAEPVRKEKTKKQSKLIKFKEGDESKEKFVYVELNGIWARFDASDKSHCEEYFKDEDGWRVVSDKEKVRSFRISGMPALYSEFHKVNFGGEEAKAGHEEKVDEEERDRKSREERKKERAKQREAEEAEEEKRKQEREEKRRERAKKREEEEQAEQRRNEKEEAKQESEQESEDDTASGSQIKKPAIPSSSEESE